MGLRAGIRLQPRPPPVTATLGASLQRAAHPQRPRQPPAATPRSGGHRAQHLGGVMEHYDVIIIGSGAGGGTLAHRLAPSGKKILLLERGATFRGSARTGRLRRSSAASGM